MSHKPNPPEPDTDTVERLYREKVEQGKIKTKANGGWKKWTSITGITCIATVALAWPIIQPVVSGVVDIFVRSTPTTKAQQGEIDTLQKNQSEQHDTLIILTNQMETVREMVTEIRDRERRNNFTPKQKDQNQ